MDVIPADDESALVPEQEKEQEPIIDIADDIQQEEPNIVPPPPVDEMKDSTMNAQEEMHNRTAERAVDDDVPRVAPEEKQHQQQEQRQQPPDFILVEDDFNDDFDANSPKAAQEAGGESSRPPAAAQKPPPKAVRTSLFDDEQPEHKALPANEIEKFRQKIFELTEKNTEFTVLYLCREPPKTEWETFAGTNLANYTSRNSGEIWLEDVQCHWKGYAQQIYFPQPHFDYCDVQIYEEDGLKRKRRKREAIPGDSLIDYTSSEDEDESDEESEIEEASSSDSENVPLNEKFASVVRPPKVSTRKSGSEKRKGETVSSAVAATAASSKFFDDTRIKKLTPMSEVAASSSSPSAGGKTGQLARPPHPTVPQKFQIKIPVKIPVRPSVKYIEPKKVPVLSGSSGGSSTVPLPARFPSAIVQRTPIIAVGAAHYIDTRTSSYSESAVDRMPEFVRLCFDRREAPLEQQMALLNSIVRASKRIQGEFDKKLGFLAVRQWVEAAMQRGREADFRKIIEAMCKFQLERFCDATKADWLRDPQYLPPNVRAATGQAHPLLLTESTRLEWLTQNIWPPSPNGPTKYNHNLVEQLSAKFRSGEAPVVTKRMRDSDGSLFTIPDRSVVAARKQIISEHSADFSMVPATSKEAIVCTVKDYLRCRVGGYNPFDLLGINPFGSVVLPGERTDPPADGRDA